MQHLQEFVRSHGLLGSRNYHIKNENAIRLHCRKSRRKCHST